jgi:hypothetical protein
VATHAQVEAAQTIARETVSATLQDHGLRLVVVHHRLDDGLEDGLVRVVRDAITEREIDSVVLSNTDADIPKFAGAWKVLSVLVERAGHDTVGGVEGLLDTISVVNVDVDVQNALLVSKELEDRENDIYNRAESLSIESHARA